MKTKPFNLEAALGGASVVNGHGDKVVQITHFPLDPTEDRYCVFGLILHKDGSKDVETYTIDGVYSVSSSNPDSPANLKLVDDTPEVKETYVNVWQNTDGFSAPYANVHPSKESADAERTVSCSKKPKTLLAQLKF